MSDEAGRGLGVLLEGSRHPDVRVVEASLKALKNILDCADVSREPIFRKGWIQLLVDFVSPDRYPPKIVETAIILVARCCEEHGVPNMHYQKVVSRNGLINQLFDILSRSEIPAVSQAQ
jgi:hypothetical protein